MLRYVYFLQLRLNKMFNIPKLIVSSLKIILQFYARSNWSFRSSWGAVIGASAVIGAQ